MKQFLDQRTFTNIHAKVVARCKYFEITRTNNNYFETPSFKITNQNWIFKPVKIQRLNGLLERILFEGYIL